MQRTTSPLAIALLAYAITACDDVTPVDYRPSGEDAAAVPDADPRQIAACGQCMRDGQGACRSAFDLCAASHPLCDPLAACLNDSNCWRQFDLSDIADLPQCSLSCYQQVGLTGLNEIATAATPLFVCLVNEPSCSFPCFGTGAPTGTEPDGSGEAGTANF